MGTKIIQTNFTAGVLDPLMIAREDTEIYYNGLAAAKNVVVQPVGGITTRPGSKKVKRLPRQLTAVSLASATLTAPHGGTAANIRDGDDTTVLTTTDDIATTNPFVVVQIDLGANTTIDAIDVINYRLSSGALNDEFFVQTSTNGTAWNNYGTAFDWTNESRTRRRRAGQVSARYIRIARIGSTAIAAKANIGGIAVWSESGTLSNGRLAPFASKTDNAYMMVVTDKNIDVLSFDDVVGSITIPHQSSALDVINWAQTLDTMLLFKKEYQPYRIFRQGDGDEFDGRKQDFDNIPKVDYGAGTGGVDEVQVLNDGGTVASGDKFTILLEGKRTTTITGGATRNDTKTNIANAINALDNLSGSGVSVTDVTDGFQVTFSGADGSQPWQEMSVSVLKGNSVWTVSRTTEGQYPGEPIVSDTRGWFRCGTFYQERLHMGGADGKPNGLVSSKVSEFYNLDIATNDDTAGLYFPLEVSKASEIFQIVAGRHLSIFTNDAEFYNAKEPIAADAIMKQSTSVGIREGLRVHDMDGALIFVQGDGASIREFLYTYDEQAYQSNNLSYKAGKLLNAPVDSDLRRAINADETDQLHIINGDGTGVIMAALRSQSVPGAFTQITTDDDGKYLSVGVDAKKRVYIITERMINGSATRFIERFDRDYTLDCAEKITMTAENVTATAGQTVFSYSFTSPAVDDAVGVRQNGARLDGLSYDVNRGAKTITLHTPAAAGDIIRIASMVKIVTGISDMDGALLHTIVDGTPSENVTVSGGSFTLTDYADTSIEWGFDFPVEGELLPPRIPGQETLTGKKVRIPRVILSLYETEGIELSVNGGPYREVPLLSLDTDILDKSQAELAFTGEKDLRGIPGWGYGVVKFRRPRPGKMTIRTITREVVI